MFKLFQFFKMALTFVEPDEAALNQAGMDRDRYVRCHKRFIIISWACAVLVGIGALSLGLYGALTEGSKLKGKDVYAIFLSPFLGVAVGCMLGATFACMIAPSDFLRGPLGRKWQDFIGTRNVLLSRIVCFIAFVILLLLAAVITVVPVIAQQIPASKSNLAK
jgi:hypothetical protein